MRKRAGSMLAALIIASISMTAIATAQEGKVNERVYELRTYTTLPGRLPALHKRFADHTMKLFEKHGMKNVVYLTPLEEENKLVYLLAHDSRDAATKSFAAFHRILGEKTTSAVTAATAMPFRSRVRAEKSP